TAAEQIVGQAGPSLGNVRGGLVAGWTDGATSLITGGLLCLLAVGAVATTTPELRDRAPGPAEEAATEHA
ncbi:MFS transporter, partial [Streptomyces sp. NPDC007856]